MTSGWIARCLFVGALSFVTSGLSTCRNAAHDGTSVPAELELAFPHLTFTRPLDLQTPADGSRRLFVVEQAGRILVFPNDPATTSASVFLDIRDKVNDAGNEEGLLGLAFHPSYRSNGYFYVNYTASNPARTVIARYRVSAADPNVAEVASAMTILEFLQPFSNHNGGQVAFGPDGYLYIAAGDGGSAGDPFGNGQSLNTLLGKILRIDVNAPAAGMNYSIPPDNPFAGTSHRGEIWAYGLRNPWRFCFDVPSGRMWAADVGQDDIEEVDIIEKGKNYGWNIMEGNSCFKPSSNCDTSGLVRPVWQYTHALGVSVTGGYIYRGSRHPELTGAYVCADYGSGRIWSLRMDAQGQVSGVELADTNLPIASFGVDESAELYICSFDGKIYRFK
ncbi:MAG: PQQ-dependent sugar dehydrogenase [Bacteroidota bacterium]